MTPAIPDRVISYRRLADAIEFYQSLGYAYVEVPWDAPNWAVHATCPDPGRVAKYSPDSGLVGSAEQSFIALDAMGYLPKGKYVACTPCFRRGDHDGDLHFETFMKVELYRTDEVNLAAMATVLHDAAEFFRRQLAGVEEYSLIRITDQDYENDITLNGVEIGSYGVRMAGALEWVYGTGVAEPRFSMALNRNPMIDPEFWDVKRQSDEDFKRLYMQDFEPNEKLKLLLHSNSPWEKSEC